MPTVPPERQDDARRVWTGCEGDRRASGLREIGTRRTGNHASSAATNKASEHPGQRRRYGVTVEPAVDRPDGATETPTESSALTSTTLSMKRWVLSKKKTPGTEGSQK